MTLDVFPHLMLGVNTLEHEKDYLIYKVKL